MGSENPNDDSDRFGEDERITANLRLRSVSPTGRTLLGFFAMIPAAWRGVVAIFFGALIGYLVFRIGPELIKWIQNGNQ
jgi:hypothetical protein